MARGINLTIEDARIIFRNFSGREGRFDPPGRGVRRFSVVLDPRMADELKADGWNVRFLPPRDADDDMTPILEVTIRYDNFPPRIFMICGNNKTLLDEEDLHILDESDIEMADIVINGSRWEVRGQSGIKAYLKTAYITISQDEFAHKYENYGR